jgi:hypothetical protein
VTAYRFLFVQGELLPTAGPAKGELS